MLERSWRTGESLVGWLLVVRVGRLVNWSVGGRTTRLRIVGTRTQERSWRTGQSASGYLIKRARAMFVSFTTAAAPRHALRLHQRSPWKAPRGSRCCWTHHHPQARCAPSVVLYDTTPPLCAVHVSYICRLQLGSGGIQERGPGQEVLPTFTKCRPAPNEHVGNGSQCGGRRVLECGAGCRRKAYTARRDKALILICSRRGAG